MQYDQLASSDLMYYFQLARKHQGNEYYCGSSGAPIADSEGKIVAVVLGGSEKTNTIYGFPLARIASLLELV
jgi:hypothetical protein